MRAYLGVTGSPGTGKKTVAPQVAHLIGLECHSLSDLAKEYDLMSKSGRGEVDPTKLRRLILKNLAESCLLHGHLLPYVLRKQEVSRVVVLRTDPRVLKRRLASRGYTRPKIKENLEAEFIGTVSAASIDRFGGSHVFEVDTSEDSPEKVSERVAEIFRSKRPGASRFDWVEHYTSVEELNSLLGP